MNYEIEIIKSEKVKADFTVPFFLQIGSDYRFFDTNSIEDVFGIKRYVAVMADRIIRLDIDSSSVYYQEERDAIEKELTHFVEGKQVKQITKKEFEEKMVYFHAFIRNPICKQ